jgi:CubicO group peptidase (beta-lactamase class C family)
MKHTILAILAFTVISSAVLGADPREDVLTSFFQGEVDRGRISGVHAIVAKNGQVVYSKVFGYSEIETQTKLAEDGIYRIASMTKVVTAIAALQLWEQGKFKLDDPVSLYLPVLKNIRVLKAGKDQSEGPPYESEPAIREPTIRDLFRHTAGIWGGKRYTIAGLRDWQGSLDDFVKALVAIPLDTQPGTRFQYGYSTDVLGLLIEKWSRQNLDEYFRQHIFGPLGLDDTGFVIPAEKLHRLVNHYEYIDGKLVCRESKAESPFKKRSKALSGGGGWNYSYPGLLTTARDWLVIMEVLRLQGAYHGTRLLKEGTVKMMCTEQLGSIPGMKRPGEGYGLGIGVVRDGVLHGKGASTGTIYWAGGPHNTYFYVDFKKRLSAALFMQSGPWRLDDIMNEFLVRSQQVFGSMADGTEQDRGR